MSNQFMNTQAVRDVVAERVRQVSEEGWTPQHDDQHESGDMALAASAYCVHHVADLRAEPAEHAPSERYNLCRIAGTLWPWSSKWWKPKTPRRDLVRAAALIIAEIERMDRCTKERI